VTATMVQVNDQNMLQQAFDVRRKVFVVEQNIPEQLELDEFDQAPTTIHILARDPRGVAVGTARMRPYHEPTVGKVERVAVVPSHRGTGLGRMLMEYLEGMAKQTGFREIRLNAQLQAETFYKRLGYKVLGSPFMEAGIQHISMWKALS
jgi:predicted GNAT family N-acyltransferase